MSLTVLRSRSAERFDVNATWVPSGETQKPLCTKDETVALLDSFRIVAVAAGLTVSTVSGSAMTKPKSSL